MSGDEVGTLKSGANVGVAKFWAVKSGRNYRGGIVTGRFFIGRYCWAVNLGAVLFLKSMNKSIFKTINSLSVTTVI